MTSSRPASSSTLDRLPPALAGLVRRPKRLSAQKPWNALEKSERSSALESFIRTQKDRQKLVKIVADARNFRENTIARWDNAKIVQWAQPLKLENWLANSLLHALHVERRREMLAHFLDTLGVPNSDGVLINNDGERGFKIPDLEESVVHDAANDLVEEHGLRRVVVYLLKLTMDGVPFADQLWSWMDGLSEPLEAVARAGIKAIPQEEKEGTETESDPARHRSFTTLDRILIEAMVDSKQGVVGSLEEDEVDDAVDEFVNLNGRRQHSYFHLGFRDVLFDRPPSQRLPASNKNRERWYWAGAILGWARVESWAKIVAAYDDNQVVQGLGDGTDFATDEAARHVVNALKQEGRPAELVNFVQVKALLSSPVSSPRLFQEMLSIGTELLSDGDVGEAQAVFDVLVRAVQRLEAEGVAPASPLFVTARRRRAHCLQRLLEHNQARRILEELLTLDPGSNHRAMVQADLGLLAGKFNSLEDVCLPLYKSELPDFLDRLHEGREHYRKAAESDVPYSAHGHYCLGVLMLAEKVLAREKEGYGKAENHLARAQGQFRRRARNYGDALVARTDLYFGIARVAHAQSAGDLNHGTRVLVRALESGASLPSYLVDPVVEWLGLGAESDLSSFARVLLNKHGDAALDALAKSGTAVDKCSEIADALWARARRHGNTEASAEDLRTCLASFLKADKGEQAADVLDRLQALAMQRIGLDEFLELLSDERNYQPGWTREEAEIARAQFHEFEGEYENALEQLRPLVHQFAADKDVDDARGLLDRIDGYGLSTEYYDQELRRVEALEEQAVGEAPEGSKEVSRVTARLDILFVGGDERQQRKDQAVLTIVRQRAPHVGVTFIHPGWSGNWRQHLERVRAELPRHDALVLMPFIRTELGRQIRKHCDKPWRSCWPSGQKGMADAVLAAASIAAKAG